MVRKLTATALCFVAYFFLSGAVLADGKPPANAKPLSEIVRSLEAQGFGPIVEIGFDGYWGGVGQWEIEAYKDGRKREVKIDPITGKTKSDRADD